MKKTAIFIIAFTAFLVVSCTGNDSDHVNKNNFDANVLANLKRQSEQNAPLVRNAKNQLLSLVGDAKFDQFIVDKGIFNCNNDSKLSECVLNFYLSEYAKLNTEMQVKKAILESQQEFSKINHLTNAVQQYCHSSANFIAMLYTKSARQSSYYRELFKLDKQQLNELTEKVAKDNYTHFLISENPTVIDEIKADFIERCIADPKANIINYTAIFN